MSKNKLLVEGDFDKGFLQKLCDSTIGKNSVEVTVLSPKDVGAYKNTWRAILDQLPILLDQLKQGDFERLGIVLDADHPPDNTGGFNARYQLVAEKLLSYNYASDKSTPNVNKGEVFLHKDGLFPIGFWIMPNHCDDGMIEGFIENMVDLGSSDQQALIAHADKTVSELPVTLFNEKLHKTKAKVNTWLAWQKKPGQLYKALDDEILKKSQIIYFEEWLKRVFP